MRDAPSTTRWPGDYGADIVVADGQSLGIPPSFGGPHLGIFAARMAQVRRLSGHLVGETVDSEGRRGYVLTLATREGLFLSGTGDKDLGNRVAAVAPLYVEEPATLRAGLIAELTDGQPMQVWRVTVRDRPFYLIGFGALTDMSEEVQHAFDRIFARPARRTAN